MKGFHWEQLPHCFKFARLNPDLKTNVIQMEVLIPGLVV